MKTKIEIIKAKSLAKLEKYKGNIVTKPVVKINKHNLKYYYSPGVVSAIEAIKKDNTKIIKYTGKSRTVAIISNGSAVLGFGNIGVKAVVPIIEAKCAVMTQITKLNVIPLVIDSQDNSDIVKTIKKINTTLGIVMLEDIKAPQCFSLVDEIQKSSQIPVFHDDRHATAIAILATLINACRLSSIKISDLKICCCGLGAAGTGVIELLAAVGVKKINAIDINGPLTEITLKLQNDIIKKMVADGVVLLSKIGTKIEGVLEGQKVFIGLSIGNIINHQWIEKMTNDPWILALALPIPEINSIECFKKGAQIVANGSKIGKSKVVYINNLKVYPGLALGILKSGIQKLEPIFSVQIAYGLAYTIKQNKLKYNYLLPNNFNKKAINNIVNALVDFVEEKNKKVVNWAI